MKNIIKEIHKEEYDRLGLIIGDAYPGMKVLTPKDRQAMIDKLIVQTKDERMKCYGYYRGGEMLGAMRLFDYTMNLFGQKVLAGGVGTVAVDLGHKKEHIAFELMQFYHDHYDKKQSPLLILYPFRPDFYRKMGFGYGTKINQYKVKPGDLPKSGRKENVRLLSEEDIPALTRCYGQYAATKTGMIYTPSVHWQNVFEISKSTRFYGFEQNGQLTGYLRFTFEPAGAAGFLDNNIVINDLVYLDRESLFGLAAFLHSQFDQIERIVLNLLDDDFHFLFADPCDGSSNLIPSVYHQSSISGVGLMYRVLDIPRMFDSLIKRNFNNQAARIKLSITDTFYDKNNRSYLLAIENGTASVSEEVDSFDVEISMDIAEFSSLVMGVVNFDRLYEFGLAEISDIDWLERVTIIFATREKPICLTAF